MLITNDVRDDGFGAQYQSIIWSILFAEVNGHTFYYTPLRTMNSDISDTKLFIEKAESHMNILNNYTYVYTLQNLENDVVFALKAPLFFFKFEKEIDRYHSSESFKRVKQLYYQNKSSPYNSQFLNVAIHIRKPAIFDGNLETIRNVNDSYFLHCINYIVERYSNLDRPLKFHIYSIGQESDFEAFKKYPIEFHLSEDTFTTFQALVFADILITTASSFSYTAALLSNNTIIYKPFWHRPLKHWIIA